MKKHYKCVIFFVGMALFSTVTFASERTGLPLDLSYFMTRAEVTNHLKAIGMYKIDTEHKLMMAFVIPDPSTKTKNGLFLKFHKNKLIEIVSTKSGMSKVLFNDYLSKLLKQAKQWKASGMSTVLESKENNVYIYKDKNSYVTIGGSKHSKKYTVDISFSEIKHHDAENN